MLRLAGEQIESLFDELLPMEVRELPADLPCWTGCWPTHGCLHQSSKPGSTPRVGMVDGRSDGRLRAGTG
jgi:hypothetical protein